MRHRRRPRFRVRCGLARGNPCEAEAPRSALHVPGLQGSSELLFRSADVLAAVEEARGSETPERLSPYAVRICCRLKSQKRVSLAVADRLLTELERATNADSKLHGVDHRRRVLSNGLGLAGSDSLRVDAGIVAVFAVLHDACRLSDGTDPQHGARAAALIPGLTAGTTTDEPTVGACWDADRLDLPRVGVRPKPEFMSTAAGKARCA